MKQIKLVVLILQGLGRGSCLPTVTQQHEEEKPCVLTVPPVFFRLSPSSQKHVQGFTLSLLPSLLLLLGSSGVPLPLAHSGVPAGQPAARCMPQLSCQPASSTQGGCSWSFSALLQEHPTQFKRDVRCPLLRSRLPPSALPLFSLVPASL